VRCWIFAVSVASDSSPSVVDAAAAVQLQVKLPFNVSKIDSTSWWTGLSRCSPGSGREGHSGRSCWAGPGRRCSGRPAAKALMRDRDTVLGTDRAPPLKAGHIAGTNILSCERVCARRSGADVLASGRLWPVFGLRF
jgi:hypothetical protein